MAGTVIIHGLGQGNTGIGHCYTTVPVFVPALIVLATSTGTAGFVRDKAFEFPSAIGAPFFTSSIFIGLPFASEFVSARIVPTVNVGACLGDW